jgi:hypothetical protein
MFDTVRFNAVRLDAIRSKASQQSIVLLLVFGSMLVVAQASHSTEPKLSPIDPPALDGKRSPSNALVPWLSRSGLFGYANRSGVMQIAPQFAEARPFYEGFAAVFVKGQGWGFIQPSGAFQIAPRYGMVTDFLDGKATASELREPVNMPLTEGVLIEGRVTQRTIDRRGVQLKERDFGANVLVDWGVSGRRFARYPEPSSDSVPGWQEVAVEDRKRGLRRVADGKLMVRANEVLVVRDIASGEARFLAGHDWNQPWSVWDLDGKPVASTLFDVYKYASEGCFYAAAGPQGWWAAYEANGHRITPYFATSPFVFRDGIAETDAVNGTTVYVDRTGRLYVDPGYLELLEAPFVRGTETK